MKARWLLALATLLPQAALAQQNSCELVDSRHFNSVSGGVVIYVGEPVFSCQNGSRITQLSSSSGSGMNCTDS